MAANKHVMMVLFLVLIVLGGVLVVGGSNTVSYISHTYPTSIMSSGLGRLSSLNAFPLAVQCADSSMLYPGPCFDNPVYRSDAWQLRWGSVDVNSSQVQNPNTGFLWREYWYTTYRFMQNFATDYDSQPIGPDCASGMDQLADGSPCTIGPPPAAGATCTPPSGVQNWLGCSAYNWIGFSATRVFKAGSVQSWPVGQQFTNIHAEFTFDDFIAVRISINGAAPIIAVAGSVAKYPLAPISGGGPRFCGTGPSSILAQPLCWDHTALPTDVISVEVLWAQYTGSALVNNSWSFYSGTTTPTCDLHSSVFTYSLIDKSHGTRPNIAVTSATASYDVDPQFVLQAGIIPSQVSQCASVITQVPVTLSKLGYNSGYKNGLVNYTMKKNSDGTYGVQIGPLTRGNYYLNVGIVTQQGVQWALAIFQVSYPSSSSSATVSTGGTGDLAAWFTDPVRLLGFLVVAAGAVGATMTVMGWRIKPGGR